MKKIKQVIVIAKYLNMRKGKMIAQGAHASVAVCLNMQSQWDSDYGFKYVKGGLQFQKWLEEGQTKICVSVDSEEELVKVYNKARSEDIPCALIRDAGHTEFGGVPTLTCCAIGPDEEDKIDRISGDLKLL